MGSVGNYYIFVSGSESVLERLMIKKKKKKLELKSRHRFKITPESELQTTATISVQQSERLF